jgi:Na+/H+ antiporter NhaD/arsenite permease-like protein
MGEAILSDTGGVATLIGDPPNILIGSASGFTFVDFITHSLPVVVIVWLAALLILRFLFRKELSEQPTNIDSLSELKPDSAFKDQKSARKILIVIAITILAFFFEGVLHIKPALIAILGATASLIIANKPISDTLKRVQWDVLIFFASLFVIIGGMQSAGVMSWLTNSITRVGITNPVILGIVILWSVAILSAFVDNIPVTIALIPLIQGLGTSGFPVSPLWWALVFGAGFGGNGTIIGSTANIVVTSISEKTNFPITAKVWNKKGLPVMIGTCVVTTIIYMLFFDLLNH